MFMITKRALAAGFAALALGGCATAAPAPQFTPTRFSVEVMGQGPDVMLIPGLASSREVWSATVAQLQATHRVLVLQVHGFAGAPAGANSEGLILAPMVEELARYIEANGLERPAIIGHSLGGLVGLMLAKAHDEEVGRVMIVDALPFFSVLLNPNATVESVTPVAAGARDQMLAMEDPAFAAMQTATMGRLLRTEALRPLAVGWSLESDRSVMARAMYEVMTTDLRGDLAQIQTPLTVVYAYDPAMGPEAMISGLYQGAYAAAPSHTLVRIDQSFHFVPLDQPGAFAAAVADFLR